MKRNESEDIWDNARKVKRGACAKIKEFLFGC